MENKIVIRSENRSNNETIKIYMRELFDAINKLANGEHFTIEVQTGTDFREVVESISEFADLLIEAYQMIRSADHKEDGYDGWLSPQDQNLID